MFRLGSLTIRLLAFVFAGLACAVPLPDHYAEKKASADGIGKVYMGREISFTLGHSGIAWLQRT